MSVISSVALLGGYTGEFFSYNLENFKFIRKIEGHSSPLLCLSNNSKTGVTASGDQNGIIKIWNSMVF